MAVEATNGTYFFLQEDMTEGRAEPFGEGEVVVFSTRSPGKDTANEDAAALIPFGLEGGILVVADGVGGHRDGEKASSLAVRSLAKSLGRRAGESGELRAAVLDGIEEANRAVTSLGGAATTLAIAEVGRNEIRPFHVGDSMILSVGQRGRIKLQTVSHSPTGYAVEAGLLDENEALVHEERHLVSNIVGADDMRIEVGSIVPFSRFDTLLIASDGLADNLNTAEIVAIVRKGPLSLAAATLAAHCRERMAGTRSDTPSKRDDLTFILYRRVRR